MYNDKEAIELLEEYGPIVRRTANSAYYSSAAISLADLCQVGNIAVLKAVRAYDPSAGANIKSFVTRIVRQDIYNEAGRFLGVFTVDHRITSLAAKVNKLELDGLSDNDIAKELNKSGARNFDAGHVRDMRIAYGRRQQLPIYNQEICDEEFTDEHTIHNILFSVAESTIERSVLEHRIMGSMSAQQLAYTLDISISKLYDIEKLLRAKIKKAIEEAL